MGMMTNYRRWRSYRRTVAELNNLTPRELSDLGISRADIHHVARGGRID